jgi:hypothetical protein
MKSGSTKLSNVIIAIGTSLCAALFVLGLFVPIQRESAETSLLKSLSILFVFGFCAGPIFEIMAYVHKKLVAGLSFLGGNPATSSSAAVPRLVGVMVSSAFISFGLGVLGNFLKPVQTVKTGVIRG